MASNSPATRDVNDGDTDREPTTTPQPDRKMERPLPTGHGDPDLNARDWPGQQGRTDIDRPWTDDGKTGVM